MNLFKLTFATVALIAATSANAVVFNVSAMANSSTGGAPLATIALTAGQAYTVTSSTDDLWSAGALPRFSDANGLVADRFATASDDSGQPVGTQIGANFGLYTQDGFSAPFGSLIGRIGTSYTLLGSNFAGTASSAGVLELFYWDSNNGDNSGSIAVDVSLVPEPASWALMIGGFAMTGAALRRRRTLVAA